MVAHAASVPAARRFVSDALADWGCADLADDVSLCASELATNATLHSGGTWFEIGLERHPDAVLLAVADHGMESVDVLAKQPELSDAFLEELSADEASTTGRGMFLVSMLASSWGIDELPAGKRVWAAFAPESGEADSAPAQVTRDPDRPEPELDPDAWRVVRFRSAPAALVLAHDDNVSEYTRELQLIGDRLDDPAFRELSAVLSGYVGQHAANWDPAKIMAHEALREGRELVDIDFLATRDIRASLEFLRDLIAECEALSEQGRLMTLVAPEPVQRVRDWMEHEFLAQIEHGADPLPWPDWDAGRT